MGGVKTSAAAQLRGSATHLVVMLTLGSSAASSFVRVAVLGFFAPLGGLLLETIDCVRLRLDCRGAEVGLRLDCGALAERVVGMVSV